MRGFSLELLSATGQRRMDGVVSFVGEDASGSFGILAGHVRSMTSLLFGLARFRCASEEWQYLAVPGGLLYFVDNHLQICCRRFLVDSDYERISTLLQQQLLSEEQALREMKESLRRMEESVLKRLWDISRPAGGGYMGGAP
ncbi:F0F1 ATP synthase subunit epsilon [Microbulbifer yueqingensis]|uniref:ATP synthase epsilon chain n=1 Tax=Microbulbifer yueqingensis TaxID=658219 RepID=A0A1G8ZXQ0_9GAMM|nr:F0F1 ATP synthase subunit epsilon [Microbulbifer yueqingensis]SDK18900.1 F-type H+-transporting ATPase subunit epsilon [Microbulbifer yueqingensis]